MQLPDRGMASDKRALVHGQLDRQLLRLQREREEPRHVVQECPQPRAHEEAALDYGTYWRQLWPGGAGHCTGGRLRTVGLGSSEGAEPALQMEYILHSGQHHRATTRQLFWDCLPCRCEATCSASDHIMNARAYTSEHGAYVVCRTFLYTSVTGLR